MASRLALVPLLVVLTVGCGGGSPSPESVVRAWSESVNSGDNDAAAELFAPGAEVIQLGQSVRLETEGEALRFNESLPCAGEIVDLETDGEMVMATFRLSDRETSRCDGPGAEVKAAFRVREGKIVLWHQLPGASDPPANVV